MEGFRNWCHSIPRKEYGQWFSVVQGSLAWGPGMKQGIEADQVRTLA